MARTIRQIKKVKLHQHVDGSIPPRTIWRLWITQFYENLNRVTLDIVEEAYRHGVRLLELRYAPAIHTYAGLTPREAIRAVLSGMKTAVRRHPDLEIGLIWEAIDLLGADRIGHGCSAVRDRRLLRRLARDRIPVECCLTSNYQTGAVARGTPHPIYTFLEQGIPVAVCTDNTTVSGTDQTRESRRLLDRLTVKEIEAIHRDAADQSFIRRAAHLLVGGRRPAASRA